MAEDNPKKKKIKLSLSPEDIKDLISNTKEPLLLNRILSWDVLKWSLDDWIKGLGDTKLDFRLGTKQCTKSLSWADVGLPDKSGKDSTIWIGTEGAYTPCHMDSYGCNIVAQVHGRKLWILFPPSSTSTLSPTRVPYEESSIYSNIHFSCGQNITEDIGEARVVELSPGDVLVVPKHWWHYVENLSTAISINMWIPRESDDVSRLEEALVRFSIATIIKGLDVDTPSGVTSLLNPNEMDLPDETIDLRQISWCTDQLMAKGKGEEEEAVNNSCSPADMDPSCVAPVTKVSAAQLRRILLDKCGCADSISNHEDHIKPNKSLTTEDVINAFCHPSVISQVAKLLINSRK
ncbi:HSPB1-associated protein 1 homolog isoform X3 [Macrosteles quadrilineatus]|uniref:HSPB1-associated protein 1 homolog isoform X3 n=1 Tax=Macrosteles quadrilineatus TaxID=74068 RepID=UPI0023E288A7|nr:HSPB1-associated protein 1 homolog isoform X3 [Macrosteles quadrilineatus]